MAGRSRESDSSGLQMATFGALAAVIVLMFLVYKTLSFDQARHRARLDAVAKIASLDIEFNRTYIRLLSEGADTPPAQKQALRVDMTNALNTLQEGPAALIGITPELDAAMDGGAEPRAALPRDVDRRLPSRAAWLGRVREGRGGAVPDLHQPHVDRDQAQALAGGGDLITFHLRSDRRHVQDQDIRRLVLDIMELRDRHLFSHVQLGRYFRSGGTHIQQNGLLMGLLKKTGGKVDREGRASDLVLIAKD